MAQGDHGQPISATRSPAGSRPCFSSVVPAPGSRKRNLPDRRPLMSGEGRDDRTASLGSVMSRSRSNMGDTIGQPRPSVSSAAPRPRASATRIPPTTMMVVTAIGGMLASTLSCAATRGRSTGPRWRCLPRLTRRHEWREEQLGEQLRAVEDSGRHRRLREELDGGSGPLLGNCPSSYRSTWSQRRNCVAPVDQLVGGCGDPPAIQDRAALAPVTRRSRSNIRETNRSACASITSSPLANRTATVLARRCRGRRCRPEGQQAGDADNPQYLPSHETDVALALVVKQARRDQPDDVSSRMQLATACGQDVLDPDSVSDRRSGQ